MTPKQAISELLMIDLSDIQNWKLTMTDAPKPVQLEVSVRVMAGVSRVNLKGVRMTNLAGGYAKRLPVMFFEVDRIPELADFFQALADNTRGT